MALPTLTTAARNERGAALLADQHARLTAALAELGDDPYRGELERQLARVERFQNHPYGPGEALGPMGPNGYGPGIDSALSTARFLAAGKVGPAMRRAA